MANNTKERKKELDSHSGNANFQSRNMKRGKPQQQIYRPGSGLLRKSNSAIEESESDTNLVINSRHNNPKFQVTQDDSRFKSEGSSPRDKSAEIDSSAAKVGDINTRDNSKRNKKPDQELYIPRPRMQENIGDNQQRNFAQSNGNDKSYEQTSGNINRSKRYSSHRRGPDNKDSWNDNRENKIEWRDKSPMGNRIMRQGSEPRGVSHNNTNWQRTRDTRSVEPSAPGNHHYNSEKSYQKPPTGRRHSTVGMERYKPHQQELPPRFKKKIMDEIKMRNQVLPEDNWDGSSITFQGSSNTHTPNYLNYPTSVGNYASLPNSHTQPPTHSGIMYSTLPARTRGRGRLSQLDYDPGLGYGGSTTGGWHNTMFSHSMTSSTCSEGANRSPCNSRPPTPPNFAGGRARSNDNLSRPDSRPQTPINFHRKDDYNRNYDRYSQPPDERHYRNNRQPDKFYRKGTHGRSDRRRSEDTISTRSNDETYRDSKEERINRQVNQAYVRDKEEDKPSQQGVSKAASPKSSEFSSLENPPPPPSPLSLEEKLSSNLGTVTNEILDWSEEVEMNYRLEAEALSDAMTRSSSVASLVDISTKSMPPTSSSNTPSNRRNKRSGSAARERSSDRQNSYPYHGQNRSRQNSHNSTDETFKMPDEPRYRRRKNSRDRRDSSYDRSHGFSRSRDCSFERTPRNSTSEHENWREEIRSRQNSERELLQRSRQNSEQGDELHPGGTRKAGIIVLPTSKQHQQTTPNKAPSLSDQPRYPEVRKTPTSKQKSLFDPNNPNKPIIVKSPGSRVSAPGFSEASEATPAPSYTTDQYGNIRPIWYNEDSSEFQASHYPELIRDIKRADNELQGIINAGLLIQNWSAVEQLRQFLKEALRYLVCKDLKFCQTENVETHLWRLIYYNIIEITRKAIQDDTANKEHYKTFALHIIEEGSTFFEEMVTVLEDTHKIRINDYTGVNHCQCPKGSGYIGLALVSAQKFFIFLGDLGRYKELVNETTNYGKCRQWYIKAHEVNPKNGRPYNQLAILAVYARRKLDAVYYYMRSLMSSNPIQNARECLNSLIDENRKKYEQGERKRREERMERARLYMKQKESEENENTPGPIRRETWIRPDGGRRVHRTTQAIQEQKDSEEEDLAALSSVEVNKRFVISYLHVHGKLITKIGMESFQEAAMQMLKEFRALLQHSPLPLPSTRLLQLLALNMFAIESTQLKDPQLQQQPGYRSELQERALVLSLQMFNLILERCVSLLQDHLTSAADQVNSLPPDASVLLPAVKIWCDWMLCHSGIWNPPPSTQDLKVGSPGDTWTRLAVLMNLLEQLDQSLASKFVNENKEGYQHLRLPEDSVLSGFTPLMVNIEEPTFAPCDLDQEAAQFVLRLSKLLFFGTVFLCGLEPPVLKLEIEDDFREYVSVVSTSNSRDSPQTTQELMRNNEVLMESFSEEEDDEAEVPLSEDTSSEVRELLTRKVELEKRHRSQEQHMQRVKKILRQSVVAVQIEVRPKYLVPDTNCFIDHLDRIATIASSHVYSVMVPIVVLGELEGLGRGGRYPTPLVRSSVDPEHIKKVGEAARKALDFLKNKHQSVKCVTTKGAILTSTTFTTEDDSVTDCNMKNDDKILATCLVLCKNHCKEHNLEIADGEPKQLIREVVLLTDDRNLRVKALARDVPVRELPDFMKWAGLG